MAVGKQRRNVISCSVTFQSGQDVGTNRQVNDLRGGLGGLRAGPSLGRPVSEIHPDSVLVRRLFRLVDQPRIST